MLPDSPGRYGRKVTVGNLLDSDVVRGVSSHTLEELGHRE